MGGSRIRSDGLGKHQHLGIGCKAVQVGRHRRRFRASRIDEGGARPILPLHQWQRDVLASYADLVIAGPIEE
jgi:hypothetical protein